MTADMNCSGMMPAQNHKTGHNQQGDDAAPQHDFTGFVVNGRKLNANAHATE